jgi:hypothetical protein
MGLPPDGSAALIAACVPPMRGGRQIDHTIAIGLAFWLRNGKQKHKSGFEEAEHALLLIEWVASLHNYMPGRFHPKRMSVT